MEPDYSAIKVELKSGKEPFCFDGKELGFDVFRFWQWSGSDLVSNTARGILAEYIVANALGLTDGTTRIEWDAFDLQTTKGIKIEVKSSSYLQSWHQRKLSSPIFRIGPTKRWDPLTNSIEGQLQRQADLYVFCLLAHQIQETLNPLDLGQWRFYLLPASVLNEKCPMQKSISFGRIISLGAEEASYANLAEYVDRYSMKSRIE